MFAGDALTLILLKSFSDYDEGDIVDISIA